MPQTADHVMQVLIVPPQPSLPPTGSAPQQFPVWKYTEAEKNPPTPGLGCCHLCKESLALLGILNQALNPLKAAKNPSGFTHTNQAVKRFTKFSMQPNPSGGVAQAEDMEVTLGEGNKEKLSVLPLSCRGKAQRTQ